jgi:hypothetical protein
MPSVVDGRGKADASPAAAPSPSGSSPGSGGDPKDAKIFSVLSAPPVVGTPAAGPDVLPDAPPSGQAIMERQPPDVKSQSEGCGKDSFHLENLSAH